MVEDNGITQISVRKETKKELDRRKISKEHKEGKTITWDDYLIERTKIDGGES